MAFGLVDQPGAEELEKFAEYLTAGWRIYGERWDDETETWTDGPMEGYEIDDEITERINEYLRHGNC